MAVNCSKIGASAAQLKLLSELVVFVGGGRHADRRAGGPCGRPTRGQPHGPDLRAHHGRDAGQSREPNRGTCDKQ